ncbi:MAG: hypothetical protein ABJN61_11705 [Flavobacteriaceae bacterium]|uniref:hypothetical protein n=1 Tax=Nonlabens ulvanivorans TaxID=906888 RepID=UPI00329A0E94
MDAKLVKGKLLDHPDLEAFRAEFYVIEKDGTPAEGRKVWLSLGEKWVHRSETGPIYESVQVTYPGIKPRITLGEKAYFTLHLVESEKFSIRIVPFNEITIKARKGKTQKVFIYLEDITYSDCTEYIDKYQS